MIEKRPLPTESALFYAISQLIQKSHAKAITQVNSTMTLLFWQVGKQINEFILENNRAEYGKQIVVTLSRQLTERFGRNFEEKTCGECSNLRKCFLKVRMS